MRAENLSSMDDFLIVGFSDLPHFQVPLFVAFLLIYLITLAGNLLIMVTVYSNSHLHTPMYFFLTKLAFLDICYTTVFFPQMLADFFQEAAHMSMTKCLMQIYFFITLIVTEVELLAIMAYDRYVAICNPLRYMAIMTKRLCMQLEAGSWAVGCMVPVGHTFLISKLSFCHSHILNHFFCEVTTLLKMSCTSTQTIESLTFLFGTLITMSSFILIITSYVKIAFSILKIKINEGRHKAFSTCASHLTVVILFYGSLCSTYMRPTSTYSMKGNQILSLAYVTITPLCNPIIYSLNNTEFKNTLKKKKNASFVKCVSLSQ